MELLCVTHPVKVILRYEIRYEDTEESKQDRKEERTNYYKHYLIALVSLSFSDYTHRLSRDLKSQRRG